MALAQGRYQTRNNRIVELFLSEARTKRTSTGENQAITVWKGNLFKADGRTLDSQKEWEESNHPFCLGIYISPGKAEGVASEFDLTERLPVQSAA